MSSPQADVGGVPFHDEMAYTRRMPVSRSILKVSPTLAFVAFWVLLTALWLAGGASRGDVPGQVVVRVVAWVMLLVAALVGERRPSSGIAPVWIFLLTALALVSIQLVPLPPPIWTALPGRTLFLDAAGSMQPWRPWSIVPSATLNAISSLVVPFAALVLLDRMRDAERAWLPAFLLVAVSASAIIGLIQFSGASFNNPLVNEAVGQVSGNFANRNHFALFMALGCLLALVWMFDGPRGLGWRSAIGVGLVLLFVLSILASGSRAGLGLGLAALLMGLLLIWRPMRRSLKHYPRWVRPAAIGGLVGAVLLFAALSVLAGRAVSVDRLFALDQGQDMRSRGIGTVLAMTSQYFPIGTGFGSFDPIFRIHEPLALLKPTYFNHAHNDFIEVVLEAGLPGLLLLGAAVVWWGWASVVAWMRGAEQETRLSRLGSAMLLLILIASVFDYPVRTPMLMTVTVVAAYWLSDARKAASASARRSPLRAAPQNL